MKYWILALTTVALAACGGAQEATDDSTAATTDAAETAAPAPTVDPNTERMAGVLAALPEDSHAARYGARHPAETLAFFGIEPGMTVVEALPGGGWYSQILVPYLGREGKLIGVDYSLEMFPLFGFFSDEQLEAKKSWTASFIDGAQAWRGDDGALIDAFVFGSRDDRFDDQADAVLMIRALHNLNRFETEGGFRTTALADAFATLRSGGILGIVQHRAADDMSDEWADGSNGYLKQAAVIEAVEAAGFVFMAAEEINANPKDQPTTEDIVWRLPPSLATSREDETLRAAMREIGESDRMTLKFVKP
ncbi:MAG: methyltransferase [Pseudomonadota bacterium]